MHAMQFAAPIAASCCTRALPGWWGLTKAGAPQVRAARATERFRDMVSESGPCGELTVQHVALPLNPNILLEGERQRAAGPAHVCRADVVLTWC